MVDNVNFSFRKACQVFVRVPFLILNLALMYFFQYTIQQALVVGCTNNIKQTMPGHHREFIYDNAFVIFNLCYQSGVFIMRSSLSLVKIRQIGFLTIAQSILFALFFANSVFTLSSNIMVWFGLIFVVGLLAGACSVNVMHLIKSSDQLEKTEKELALNISFVCNDCGTLLASLVSLALTT